MQQTILFILSLSLILGVFEILAPAERHQTPEGRLRNMVFTGIFLALGGGFASWAVSLLKPEMTLLPDHGVFFSVLIILFYLLLGDLIFYWYHRAQHHFPWLWALHELHHSDAELNASTSMRTYWLERPIQMLIIIVPVNHFLGLDPMALALVPLISTSWLFFAHANWRLNLGWLTPVLTGPQLHRIHHSTLPQHEGKNFAQFFPVLDIVFGTYYRPAKDEYPPTGTPELATDAPVLETLMRPARLWSRASKAFLRLF